MNNQSRTRTDRYYISPDQDQPHPGRAEEWNVVTFSQSPIPWTEDPVTGDKYRALNGYSLKDPDRPGEGYLPTTFLQRLPAGAHPDHAEQLAETQPIYRSDDPDGLDKVKQTTLLFAQHLLDLQPDPTVSNPQQHAQDLARRDSGLNSTFYEAKKLQKSCFEKAALYPELFPQAPDNDPRKKLLAQQVELPAHADPSARFTNHISTAEQFNLPNLSRNHYGRTTAFLALGRHADPYTGLTWHALYCEDHLPPPHLRKLDEDRQPIHALNRTSLTSSDDSQSIAKRINDLAHDIHNDPARGLSNMLDLRHSHQARHNQPPSPFLLPQAHPDGSITPLGEPPDSEVQAGRAVRSDIGEYQIQLAVQRQQLATSSRLSPFEREL